MNNKSEDLINVRYIYIYVWYEQIDLLWKLKKLFYFQQSQSVMTSKILNLKSASQI